MNTEFTDVRSLAMRTLVVWAEFSEIGKVIFLESGAVGDGAYSLSTLWDFFPASKFSFGGSIVHSRGRSFYG